MPAQLTEVPRAPEALVHGLDIHRATPEAVLSLRGPELSAQSVAYLDALSTIEQQAQRARLDHRFVGGVIADFFREPGFIALIDPSTRTIHLGGNYQAPSAIRNDGTVKDADMICFTPNYQTYQTARSDLKALEANSASPKISLEATRYYHVGELPDSGRHPTRRARIQLGDWPQRETGVKSMVSTLDVFIDKQGESGLYMNFANPGKTLQQRIPQESMEPWQLVIHGQVNGKDRTWTITTIAPEALLLRYLARNPAGLKIKDTKTETVTIGNQEVEVNKLLMLSALAQQTRYIAEQMRTEGIAVPDFDAHYASWYAFVNKFLLHQDLETYLKTLALRIYWGTPIGQFLAHHLPSAGDIFAGGDLKGKTY